MIVRLPEFEIGLPSRATLLSVAGKLAIAAVLVALLVVVADWRLNGRMDRSGLERLAGEVASDPVTTGSIEPKAKKR